MLERLRNNLELKVLALLLAIGAWGYFRFAANPAIAAHFDQQFSVPLITTGLGPNEIARFGDKQAIVTIVSPRGATTQVRPDDLRAVLNLAGRGPGVYSVGVTVIAPRLEVKSITPPTETLQIETIDGRQVPVAVRYTGDAHGLVTSTVRIDPSAATVRGASSDVARVANVRVDVAFPAAGERVDGMVRAVPVDARGDEVAGVAVTPNLVRTRANFRQARTT
jgi:YbbR domain-containing protein